MKQLKIVCDRIPDQDGCIFIECEDEVGVSAGAGIWRGRPDGLSELVIDMECPHCAARAYIQAKIEEAQS